MKTRASRTRGRKPKISVLDDINNRVAQIMGSEETRALIILKVEEALNNKPSISIYDRYREDSTARQKILHFDHPDFPELAKMDEENRYLLRQLRIAQFNLNSSTMKYSTERHNWSKVQRNLIEERKHLKARLKARVQEILGDTAFMEKRRNPRDLNYERNYDTNCTGKFIPGVNFERTQEGVVIKPNYMGQYPIKTSWR